MTALLIDKKLEEFDRRLRAVEQGQVLRLVRQLHELQAEVKKLQRRVEDLEGWMGP